MDVQELEIKLLLDALRYRAGFDIRHYAQASLRRRLLASLASCGVHRISDAIPMVIHEPEFFNKLIYVLSVTFTEFFRDPQFFRVIRTRVIPILRTYPFINIWHAGCSTGEEVYSMAILLREEGLLGKTRIYATDFNDQSLWHAEKARYDSENLKACEANYLQSGGSCHFSDYCQLEDGMIHMDSSLTENIVFSSMNLATDNVFTQAHLVICRNVLIYFDRILQNRILSLLHNTLVHGGVLCLGSHETLQFSDVSDNFLPVSEKWKVFQKRVTVPKTLAYEDPRKAYARTIPLHTPKRIFNAVVIGCSSGGMMALRLVLGKLPPDFPVPVIVVQHLAAGADMDFLTANLSEHTVLNVVEAQEKQKAQRGHIYIAPPGYHLLLEYDSTFSLTNDPRVHYSRPAIDILFESASAVFREQLIGVLLTGANSDGARGLEQIRASGGFTIVQDPQTAEAAQMPRAAIALNAADRVLPLSEIASELCLQLGCTLP